MIITIDRLDEVRKSTLAKNLSKKLVQIFEQVSKVRQFINIF